MNPYTTIVPMITRNTIGTMSSAPATGFSSDANSRAKIAEAERKIKEERDALHAKYQGDTGQAVVGDSDWGHLQLDATALYKYMVLLSLQA